MTLSWLTLVLSDWRRRPLRTAVTAAGVAIAVAALFSLLAFQRGYQSGMQSELDRLGAQVLVVPKGCPYDAASIALHGANWPCYLKAEYLDEVRAIKPVATAAPVLMSAFDDQGHPIVYVGVDDGILRLKPGWRIQGRFPQTADQCLVGAEVARQNGWSVGQTVHLPHLEQAVASVSGVLVPTHGADDGFIFLRLAAAQSLFHHEHELTHILVRLTDPDQLDSAVAQLRGCNAGMDMNVVPLAHLFRSIQALIGSARVWLGCVAVIALCVAMAGVANTILMAVAERTREIGVMRALGAARGDVFRLFWFQTLQICLIGSMAGMTIAFCTSRLIEAWLRARLPFAPSDALIRWEWPVVLICAATTVALGTIAGFLPAWRAANLSPKRAMNAAEALA